MAAAWEAGGGGGPSYQEPAEVSNGVNQFTNGGAAPTVRRVPCF